MVLFHTCYDVAYVYRLGAEWFKPPLQTVWRFSISWVFLLLAGWMCNLSRSNAKRALRYLAAALVIYAVTSLAGFDAPISYGIIYGMGASTLLWALLERLHLVPGDESSARAELAVSALFFLAYWVLRDMNAGFVHLGFAELRLSGALNRLGCFSWLGFPGPGFVSSDYYPPLPYSLIFLAGAWLGHAVMRSEAAVGFLQSHGCKPLEFLGRHSLEVYLLHQPLVIAVLELAARV